MTIVTVWNNAAGEVLLAQLSDDEADGTPAEQISYMGTLDAYAGFTCVCPDFTGAVPDATPDLWRWDGQGLVAIEAPTPPAEPTIPQVAQVLTELGMTPEQLDRLFRLAATL